MQLRGNTRLDARPRMLTSFAVAAFAACGLKVIVSPLDASICGSPITFHPRVAQCSRILTSFAVAAFATCGLKVIVSPLDASIRGAPITFHPRVAQCSRKQTSGSQQNVFVLPFHILSSFLDTVNIRILEISPALLLAVGQVSVPAQRVLVGIVYKVHIYLCQQ